MPLKDLSDFLEDDALRIPVKSPKFPDGKTYTIPSPNAETGLRLQAMAHMGFRVATGDTSELSKSDAKALEMDDDEERDFLQMVLGSAYDEMLADGVSWIRIQRLGQYAFTYFAISPSSADQAVKKGLFSGEAQPPNRAAKRNKKKPAIQQDRPVSAGSKKAKTRA